MKTPRQWGKSLFLINHALIYLSNKPNKLVWYVMPSWSQCKVIWNKYVVPLLTKRGVRLIKKANSSDLRVELVNGSVLEFKTAENFEKLRSATLDGLICDEFAFFREGAYELALEPMLLQHGEWAIFNSTPKGKNKFYEFYQRGVFGSPTYDPRWGAFESTVEETGIANYIEEVYAKRKHLPDAYYRQEYLGEFIDNGGSVFTNLTNAFTLHDFAPYGKKHYAGVDIGKRNDRTVITVLNEKGQCVFWKRFEIEEQKDGVEMAQLIANYLNDIPNLRCLWETNFDPSVFDMVRRKAKKANLIKFTTTNDSKNNIISKLNASLSLGTVALPTFAKEIEEELISYEMNLSTVRSLPTYNAPSGMHDDCVMSLALANHIYMNYEKPIK